MLGNAGREVLRAEQGRMERADAGGTAVYTVRLQSGIHTSLYGGNHMKIERKYMAHYLNAAFGSGDASCTRLGSDLEEYSPS